MISSKSGEIDFVMSFNAKTNCHDSHNSLASQIDQANHHL